MNVLYKVIDFIDGFGSYPLAMSTSYLLNVVANKLEGLRLNTVSWT